MTSPSAAQTRHRQARDAGRASRRGRHRHHDLRPGRAARRARRRAGQPLRRLGRRPAARGRLRGPRPLLRAAGARARRCPPPRSPRSATSPRSTSRCSRPGTTSVSIHIASGLSGTLRERPRGRPRAQRRRPAGHDRRRRRPDRRRRARLPRDRRGRGGRAGAALEQVGGAVADARSELDIWFCLDTLEYLRRGGRIGAARALLGSALRIKPILTFGTEITPVGRVRTRSRALRADGGLPGRAAGARRDRLDRPARAVAGGRRAPRRPRDRDPRQAAALLHRGRAGARGSPRLRAAGRRHAPHQLALTSGALPALGGELDEQSSAAGLASDSRLAACSGGVPIRIRLTGTSSTLPDSVRGTSAIAWTSFGHVARRAVLADPRAAIRLIRSSSSSAPSRRTTNSGIQFSSPSRGTSTTSASAISSSASTAR